MKEAIKRPKEQQNTSANGYLSSANTTIPNSVLCDVISGYKRPTSEMMGHRTDLAPSIQAKMSKAFGMDFSNLSLYKSDVMKDTGNKGMAQGNSVVLSSDINLNTLEGQAILGHELSHIHAQSMGIGLGHSGLYTNDALERQADTEGMMAAKGMNIFGESSSMDMGTGMLSFDSLTPIGSGMGTTAGAPMQAKDKPTRSHGTENQQPVQDADVSDSVSDSLDLDNVSVFDRKAYISAMKTLNSVNWKKNEQDLPFNDKDDKNEYFQRAAKPFDKKHQEFTQKLHENFPDMQRHFIIVLLNG